MSDQVQFVVELTIGAGGLARFKELAQAATDAVQAQEPGTIGYQWYISEDQKCAFVIEWYAHADLIPGHMQLVHPILVQMGEVSQVARFEVFGNLTEAAKQALAPAKPGMYGYWLGFTRCQG